MKCRGPMQKTTAGSSLPSADRAILRPCTALTRRISWYSIRNLRSSLPRAKKYGLGCPTNPLKAFSAGVTAQRWTTARNGNLDNRMILAQTKIVLKFFIFFGQVGMMASATLPIHMFARCQLPRTVSKYRWTQPIKANMQPPNISSREKTLFCREHVWFQNCTKLISALHRMVIKSSVKVNEPNNWSILTVTHKSHYNQSHSEQLLATVTNNSYLPESLTTVTNTPSSYSPESLTIYSPESLATVTRQSHSQQLIATVTNNSYSPESPTSVTRHTHQHHLLATVTHNSYSPESLTTVTRQSHQRQLLATLTNISYSPQSLTTVTRQSCSQHLATRQTLSTLLHECHHQHRKPSTQEIWKLNCTNINWQWNCTNLTRCNCIMLWSLPLKPWSETSENYKNVKFYSVLSTHSSWFVFISSVQICQPEKTNIDNTKYSLQATNCFFFCRLTSASIDAQWDWETSKSYTSPPVLRKLNEAHDNLTICPRDRIYLETMNYT